MMLCEMKDRLKKTPNITEEQMWEITPLYLLLDLHKDDFCKIVDAVGLDKLLEKALRWKRLETAEQEHTAKLKYLDSKRRLEELESERGSLQGMITDYEAANRM